MKTAQTVWKYRPIVFLFHLLPTWTQKFGLKGIHWLSIYVNIPSSFLLTSDIMNISNKPHKESVNLFLSLLLHGQFASKQIMLMSQQPGITCFVNGFWRKFVQSYVKFYSLFQRYLILSWELWSLFKWWEQFILNLHFHFRTARKPQISSN